MSASAEKTYNVLFLCKFNSARSIMAEALLRKFGAHRFTVASAGSDPAETIHPYTKDLLVKFDHDLGSLTPKSWDQFAGRDGQGLDFVIIVGEETLRGNTPNFPGDPLVIGWPFDDPVAVDGNEAIKRATFAQIYGQIERRVRILASLPIHALDRLKVKAHLENIQDDIREAS